MRGWKLPRVASGAVLVALVAAGCGGGGGGGEKHGSQQQAFALLRLSWPTPDYVDPQLAYSTASAPIVRYVYLGPYGYKDASGPAGTTVVPVLAEKLPAVSQGGRLYQFRLKPGLHYSDGSPVQASDFRASVERMFRLDSHGVGFFSSIVGAAQFSKTKTGHISGITANDATRTIGIRLTEPRGDFLQILALTLDGLVPARTPAKNESASPPPGTGPYEIQSYAPNKRLVLVRNPRFQASKIPTVFAGNPDKVVFTLETDPGIALQQVLLGKSDYDWFPVPVDRLQEVKSKHGDRLRLYALPQTFGFYMNVTIPPFDKLQLRRAVNYAIDRDALVQLAGGLARPTQNVLPPAFPQYRKITYYHHDLKKAKELVRAAGAEGAKVGVWGFQASGPPTAEATYLADVLHNIGLKPTLKLLAPAVYFQTVANPATKAQIMWGGWSEDYPHPLDFFDTQFNGSHPAPSNLSEANFPDVNADINRLKREQLSPSVNRQWADLDHSIVVDHAAVANFQNPVGTDFFGKKVDLRCYLSHPTFFFDWTKICLK